MPWQAPAKTKTQRPWPAVGAKAPGPRSHGGGCFAEATARVAKQQQKTRKWSVRSAGTRVAKSKGATSGIFLEPARARAWHRRGAHVRSSYSTASRCTRVGKSRATARANATNGGWLAFRASGHKRGRMAGLAMWNGHLRAGHQDYPRGHMGRARDAPWALVLRAPSHQREHMSGLSTCHRPLRLGHQPAREGPRPGSRGALGTCAWGTRRSGRQRRGLGTQTR